MENSMIDKELLAIVCEKCQLLYEVRDGIPIMLIDEAKDLADS